VPALPARHERPTVTLRVIPLGGVGEFGMNMMLYETDESAIVVDCGMMFPDASILGVDVIIPDMSWVFERAEKIDGIFLTHGHEDHVGATPFLIEKVTAPSTARRSRSVS
jgi:ribonuclease J